jgi:hypothetical protein
MPDSEAPEAHPMAGVRFNSVQQEISPPSPLDSESLKSPDTPAHEVESREDISDEAKQSIRDDLARSWTHTNAMSSARLNHFVFDPVSLPPSRVGVHSSTTAS